MIQQIKNTGALKDYLTKDIEDAGLKVEVDSALGDDEFIAIKIDNYYMGLHLGGETPKAVDFVVAVDCQCDSYVLYVLELKNVKSPNAYTMTEIIEKFETAIERFLKLEFKDIFLNDRYKYKEVKLYLVTTAYGKALGQANFKKYAELMKKINGNDTLIKDCKLTYKCFHFKNRLVQIEREIPPNPVIMKQL